MNDIAEIDAVWARLGESGESGENPSATTGSAWRKNGEQRRQVAKAAPAVILGTARARLDLQPLAALEYPTDALGPLTPACEAIAEGGQMAAAMAGQSLLATSALLAQSCADVRTLAGIKPLSLYAFTIADSGDGKSTAEGVAMKPIRERQREEAEAHRQQVQDYQREKATRKKGEPIDAEVGRHPFQGVSSSIAPWAMTRAVATWREASLCETKPFFAGGLAARRWRRRRAGWTCAATSSSACASALGWSPS